MDSREKDSGRLVGHRGKEPACQCRRQKETLQPPLVLLPGESHGQRSMAGCRPWGHAEVETTEATAHTHTHTHTHVHTHTCTHTVGHTDWHLLPSSDLCQSLSVGGSSIGSTFLNRFHNPPPAIFRFFLCSFFTSLSLPRNGELGL